MNILHINTLDIRGGAAKVCHALVEEQKRRGHTVTTFVGYKHSTDPSVHEIPKNPLQYRLSKFFADDLRFSRSDWIFGTDAYKQADIVHCHNIHSGFFNLTTLEKISREKPTVWTLQDVWALTAGCTSSYGCRLEKPQRVAGFLWDTRARLLKRKAEIYRRSAFTVVATSDWVFQKLQTSILKDRSRRLIYNGIDTSIFTPHDKHDARQALKLPADKTIVLFVAIKGIANRLKGANFVAEIAHHYRDDDTKVFVAIGGDTTGQDGNIIQAGYVEGPTLAQYYAAADFFLYPSRGDNSPLVVAESLACGTPVVSFETDGIPEMVAGCGLLAKREDGEDLQRVVQEMLALRPEQLAAMRAAGLKRVQERYTIKKMADEYDALYAERIKGRSVPL